MQAVRVDQVHLTRLQARLHHLSDFKRRRKMPPGAGASAPNMSSHPSSGKYCLRIFKYCTTVMLDIVHYAFSHLT